MFRRCRKTFRMPQTQMWTGRAPLEWPNALSPNVLVSGNYMLHNNRICHNICNMQYILLSEITVRYQPLNSPSFKIDYRRLPLLKVLKKILIVLSLYFNHENWMYKKTEIFNITVSSEILLPWSDMYTSFSMFWKPAWWWPRGVETCSWMNYFIKLCLMVSCF